MSNVMIALLTVFAFAAGLGLGLVLVMRPKPPARKGQRTESTVYFGRNDDDHPDDIERAGSHLVPAPSASPYVNGRDYGARYDGMADIEHLHDQQDRA